MIIPKDKKDRICLQILSLLSHDDGTPVDKIITPGQLEIFRAIVFREWRRIQFTTCTQYGKSWVVALACLVVTCIQGETITVVAPSGDKAKIIMRYFIQHLGDHELFYSQLEKTTRLERLRQEESKERITLRNGAGMYTVSANASNSKKSIEAAMGEGSTITVLDEAGLIPDATEATVFRMIAGKGRKATYVKIGNSFYRNHFYKSSVDPTYHNITIDYIQALSEGRYNEEFIAEARRKPLFDILFECKFPPEDEILAGGWRRIITRPQLDNSFTDVWEPGGRGRLGVDIAAGGNDFTVITARFPNVARILKKWRDADIMAQIPIIIDTMKDYNIDATQVFIDDTAIGHGITNRMHEMNIPVNGVRLGNKAIEEAIYSNIRTEDHWLAAQWLKEGGKLYSNEFSNGFYDLTLINYKEDTNSKLKLEPKLDMMAREGVKSPDEVDSFILTFANALIGSSSDLSF